MVMARLLQSVTGVASVSSLRMTCSAMARGFNMNSPFADGLARRESGRWMSRPEHAALPLLCEDHAPVSERARVHAERCSAVSARSRRPGASRRPAGALARRMRRRRSGRSRRCSSGGSRRSARQPQRERGLADGQQVRVADLTDGADGAPEQHTAAARARGRLAGDDAVVARVRHFRLLQRTAGVDEFHHFLLFQSELKDHRDNDPRGTATDACTTRVRANGPPRSKVNLIGPSALL